MTLMTRQRDALQSKLVDTDGPGDWMTQAACIGMWDVFHLNPGESPDHAKAICRECPVRTPCRDYADEHGDDHGIYGGLTPAERRQVRQLKKKLHRPVRESTWKHRPDLVELMTNSRADNRVIASIAGVHADTVARWRREIAEVPA